MLYLFSSDSCCHTRFSCPVFCTTPCCTTCSSSSTCTCTCTCTCPSLTQYRPCPTSSLHTFSEGHSHSLPLIDVVIAGISLQALVDTGSSISLLSKSVFNSLSPANRPVLTSHSATPRVQSVTDQPVSVLGSTSCAVSLHSVSVLHTLLVASIQPDVILALTSLPRIKLVLTSMLSSFPWVVCLFPSWVCCRFPCLTLSTPGGHTPIA